MVSHSSTGLDFVDDLKSQGSKNMANEDIPTIGSFVVGLKDAKFQYEKQIRGCQVWESGTQSDETGKNQRNTNAEPSPDWFNQLESLRGRIIELWHTCNASLVHRTYFFVLFKGYPTDSIYLEVELRRLSFLKERSSLGQQTVDGGWHSPTVASRSFDQLWSFFILCGTVKNMEHQFKYTEVLSLNGKPIKNLKSLAHMVESCEEDYLKFDLEYQQVLSHTFSHV